MDSTLGTKTNTQGTIHSIKEDYSYRKFIKEQKKNKLPLIRFS